MSQFQKSSSLKKAWTSYSALHSASRCAVRFFKYCSCIHVSVCTIIISALLLQLKERKLKDIEKDYPAYLEQQAELEDPVRRLEVSVHSTIDKYMTL